MKNQKKDISILIPYQHSKERYELLIDCMRTLPNPEIEENVEICIIEAGLKPRLNDLYVPYEIVYGFVKYHDVFHRAWTINIGARNLVSGKFLVIMDGDLLCNAVWFEEIKERKDIDDKKIYVGWHTICYLTNPATKHYKENRVIKPSFSKIRRPNISGAAGGVTCIQYHDFIGMKGIPEYFEGTWGGEDNAFMYKMLKFGYKVEFFEKSRLYHMYHKKTTPRNKKIMFNVYKMKTWTNKKWTEELKRVDSTWGKPKY